MFKLAYNTRWGFLVVFEETVRIAETRVGNAIYTQQVPEVKRLAKLSRNNEGQFDFDFIEDETKKIIIKDFVKQNGYPVAT